MRLRLAAAALLLLASPARAITVTEPPDLSEDALAPTPITLDLGTNTVSGRLQTPGDRQDNFRITVQAGHRLTAVSLTLDTSGGFAGSVTFNMTEVRTTSGSFTMGFPHPAGSYLVQVITDFAVGNAWSMTFTVGVASASCGNGTVEAGEDCDDANAVECDGCASDCRAVPDGCAIDGSCVADGAIDPANACRSCQRSITRAGYSPRAPGAPCDDGMFCTIDDGCDAAAMCVGAGRDCADALGCTADVCDEATDACSSALASGCLIGGACIPDGTPDPTNACAACIPAMTTSAYSPRPSGTGCEDGSFCTSGDVCDGAGACGPGFDRVCDDGDACTEDACDEAGDECVSEPICGSDAGTADAGNADAGTITAGDGGCGCRAARGDRSWLWIAALALLALSTRSRASRRSSDRR